MLIVAGEITCEAGSRDRCLAAVAPMVAATRQEVGCRSYVFSPDTDDEALIHLYELWDDADALAGHFASTHMAEWNKVKATLPFTGMSIMKYTIADSEPLG